jgi:hypothetical protein
LGNIGAGSGAAERLLFNRLKGRELLSLLDDGVEMDLMRSVEIRVEISTL